MSEGGKMLPALRAWSRTLRTDDRGLNTAELMGNAALAIAALVVIWAALEALGLNVVQWISAELLGS